MPESNAYFRLMYFNNHTLAEHYWKKILELCKFSVTYVD